MIHEDGFIFARTNLNDVKTKGSIIKVATIPVVLYPDNALSKFDKLCGNK